MPNSGPEFERALAKLVDSLKPGRVLDVGVGSGKTARIVHAVCPTATVEGVEACASYADKFRQQWGAYETVWAGREATAWSLENSNRRYDLVVMGDVLEHLWKHSALALVEYWTARSKFVVCVWPTGWPQDERDGVMWEIHRCELTLRDFVMHGLHVVRFHECERPKPGQFKSMLVVRGRLAQRSDQAGVAYV